MQVVRIFSQTLLLNFLIYKKEDKLQESFAFSLLGFYDVSLQMLTIKGNIFASQVLGTLW